MNLELVRATMYHDDTILRNLFQFYLYEYTRFMSDWRVTEGGRFFENDLDGCWTRPNRHIFLFRVDGDLAGFAFVDQSHHSLISEEEDRTYMAEFFIMAAFQKQGLGAQAAAQCFDKFPGKWEVFQMQENLGAQHFWRKVIGRYTNEQYQETASPEHLGIVQTFDNSFRAKT